MPLLHIERDPSRRQLAVFGLCWAAAFAGLGGILLRRTGSPWVAGACWAVAALVPAAGALRPGALRLVFIGTALATAPLGLVTSVVVLAAMYYLVVAPIGLLLRAFGHDAMGRRFDPRAKSYWVKRAPEPGPERYFRQF